MEATTESVYGKGRVRKRKTGTTITQDSQTHNILKNRQAKMNTKDPLLSGTQFITKQIY